MRAVFLLCAAFALSTSAAPTEDVPEELAVQSSGKENLLPVEDIDQSTSADDAGKSGCPPGWVGYGSRCFMFKEIMLSWIDAEKFCQRNGGNLASVHSRDEYKFIQAHLLSSTGGFQQTWLGAHHAVKDFVFLWSDGSEFMFQFWNTGEPNNIYGREKCVLMNQAGGSSWSDANCDFQLPFVCAKK